MEMSEVTDEESLGLWLVKGKKKNAWSSRSKGIANRNTACMKR